MAAKRSKKKRQGTSGRSASRGGSLSGLRGGFKGIVGQGPRRKSSRLSQIASWVLIAAAVGLVAYRLLQ